MDKSQAEESIKLIRDVMEKSARYTHFSGLSGVLSGVLALVGCAITYWINFNLPQDQQNTWYIVTWCCVLISAITEDFILSQSKAKADGSSIWKPITYQVLKAVLPGILVALVISLFAMETNQINAIPGVWALGYGAALCAAGLFSVREVRVYGIIQLITGTLGLLVFRQSPYNFYQLALSFGVYQILFGLWLTGKHRN